LDPGRAQHAQPVGAPGRVLQQRGLPDAGRPGEDQYGALPGPDLVERLGDAQALGVPPDQHGVRVGYAPSARTYSEVTGRPKCHPCAPSQPTARSRWACISVSTPSAVTTRPRLCPSVTSVVRIASSVGSTRGVRRPSTNGPASFS